jgi:serine/threonine-protein kinase
MSDTPPKVLGDLILDHPIGSGSSGHVFEGRSATRPDPVAIKVLHRELSESPEFVKRFQQEAFICESLIHPNIVIVHSAGVVSGWYFMVMEMIRGRRLDDLLREEPPSLLRIVEILMAITRAVQYAEKTDVVHRDLKPANVMVREDGTVKVLDYGLARVRAGVTQITESGTVLGSPHYMAPEQSRAREVDVRADLWAIGVTAYEMVTGKRPFEGPTFSETIYAVNYDDPVDPMELRPDLPREFAQIILRLLAKSPDARVQSPRRLLNMLNGVMSNLYYRQERAPRGESIPTPHTGLVSSDDILMGKIALEIGALTFEKVLHCFSLRDRRASTFEEVVLEEGLLNERQLTQLRKLVRKERDKAAST